MHPTRNRTTDSSLENQTHIYTEGDVDSNSGTSDMGRVRRQTQLLRLLLDISIFVALLAVAIIVMITQNRVIGWG